ncbi:MAG: hypothetical protein LW884_04750 [Bacteroidetes bacterium]|jgi:hypothetical protein|nr:hypothetical protein [Bacteroidota bacterium]
MKKVLLILCALPTLAGAQTAGYLGHRFYVLGNAYLFPNLRYQPFPSMRWNLRQEAAGGFVLGPQLATELQLGFLTTTLPYKLPPAKPGQVGTGRGSSDDYLRINSYYLGLRAKYFLRRLAGGVAPVGLYAALAAQHHWALAYEPDASSGRLKAQYGGYHQGWTRGLALQAELGNHWVVADRFLIDVGVQTGLWLSTGQSSKTSLSPEQLRPRVQARLLNHTGLNVKLGFGLLLY